MTTPKRFNDKVSRILHEVPIEANGEVKQGYIDIWVCLLFVLRKDIKAYLVLQFREKTQFGSCSRSLTQTFKKKKKKIYENPDVVECHRCRN